MAMVLAGCEMQCGFEPVSEVEPCRLVDVTLMPRDPSQKPGPAAQLLYARVGGHSLPFRKLISKLTQLLEGKKRNTSAPWLAEGYAAGC